MKDHQSIKPIQTDACCRWLPWAAVILALMLAIFAFYSNRAFYHDDAFITLRYADNFLHGHGLVWNTGEYVEGYSNFGFLILIVALGKLGLNLIAASRIINIAAFIALIIAISGRSIIPGRSRSEPCLATVLPLMMILTSFPFIVWTLGGLEGPLFSLLCLMGMRGIFNANGGEVTFRRVIMSGLFLGLACLTRMDGLILVVATIFCLWIFGGNQRWKTVVAFTASFALIYGPYFIWRVWYYGELLPNTYYVKAGNFEFERIRQGMTYFGDYLITAPFILMIFLLLALIVLVRKIFDRKILYILLSSGAYLAFIVYVGGDHMPAYRFMLLPTALTILLLREMLWRLSIRINPGLAAGSYGIMLVLAISQILYPNINPRRMDNAAYVGRAVGLYIKTAWPDNSLVALHTAGSTPYYAPNHHYVDMLGLNDKHIARRMVDFDKLPWQNIPGHGKGDGDYIISRNPDFIILGPAEGTTIRTPWFLSDLELAQSPEFLRQYSLRQVNLSLNQATPPDKADASSLPSIRFSFYERTH